jgi:hypothetical protein
MTDNELNRAVARATGETVSEIRSRGFSLVTPDSEVFEPPCNSLVTRSRQQSGHRSKGVPAEPALGSHA